MRLYRHAVASSYRPSFIRPNRSNFIRLYERFRPHTAHPHTAQRNISSTHPIRLHERFHPHTAQPVHNSNNYGSNPTLLFPNVAVPFYGTTRILFYPHAILFSRLHVHPQPSNLHTPYRSHQPSHSNATTRPLDCDLASSRRVINLADETILSSQTGLIWSCVVHSNGPNTTSHWSASTGMNRQPVPCCMRPIRRTQLCALNSPTPRRIAMPRSQQQSENAPARDDHSGERTLTP